MQTTVQQSKGGLLSDVIRAVITALISIVVLKEIFESGLHIRAVEYVQGLISQRIFIETSDSVMDLLSDERALPAVVLMMVLAVVVR